MNKGIVQAPVMNIVIPNSKGPLQNAQTKPEVETVTIAIFNPLIRPKVSEIQPKGTDPSTNPKVYMYWISVLNLFISHKDL